MILETLSPPSGFPVVLLILAIWGAVADRRYKRKGGKKSSNRDKVMFLIALVLIVALFVVLGLIGGSSADIGGMIGQASPVIAILLFALWELGRWRVRRNNPLPTGSLKCLGCGRNNDPSAKFCPACGKAL
jgi:hypothetical protein